MARLRGVERAEQDLSGQDGTPVEDPDAAYRRGALDLLGILAYGALVAFDRLAEDARLAPTLADKASLASMAAHQVRHFERVGARLAEFGVDVMAAMRPFHEPFNTFHDHTHPKDWLEGLVKAYVGDGIGADFYREVAAFVDADTRALVHEVLADEGMRTSWSSGSVPRSTPTRAWRAGSRCGADGWWARP
jgi:1,2-phenylacetyl-CoA epoxidase catalytic subunit